MNWSTLELHNLIDYLSVPLSSIQPVSVQADSYVFHGTLLIGFWGIKSMSNIHIRAASSEDAEVLADFNIKMAAETENKTLDPKLIHNGILKIFAEPDLGFYTLIEVDGEVAGALMITTEWSDWRNGLFWWIQSVYIKPEFRRQGVFSALYTHIREAAAQQSDVCGLRLPPYMNNPG